MVYITAHTTISAVSGSIGAFVSTTASVGSAIITNLRVMSTASIDTLNVMNNLTVGQNLNSLGLLVSGTSSLTGLVAVTASLNSLNVISGITTLGVVRNFGSIVSAGTSSLQELVATSASMTNLTATNSLRTSQMVATGTASLNILVTTNARISGVDFPSSGYQDKFTFFVSNGSTLVMRDPNHNYSLAAQTVTGSVTLTASADFLQPINTASNAVNVYLPNILLSADKYRFCIYDAVGTAATNNINIYVTGSYNRIVGTMSYTILGNYNSITVLSDGLQGQCSGLSTSSGNWILV